ncbi:MAG: hypothetical protein LBP39_01985 [Rickettsiales bacterium]|jgi:F-type H+-transporting ATPase subunit b|nr:hypothetical protein [Rickettsiales bacterium]
MNIDIFTLIVQIVNFSLLLFILRKFLYKPIAKAIHDRQEHIKNTIEVAESKLRDAENKNEMYQAELDKMETYRKNSREKIDYELTKYKASQTEKINEEIEDKKVWLWGQFEAEKEVLLNGIVKNICAGVGGFMMDVFSSLTNNSLENSTLDKFFDEINNFSNELIDKINRNSADGITFTSSFELNNSQRNALEKIFKKKGIIYENINFVVNKEIGIGNQIIVGSLTINSSTRNIVDQFRAKLEQII